MVEDDVASPELADQQVVLDTLVAVLPSRAAVFWSQEVDLDDTGRSPFSQPDLPPFDRLRTPLKGERDRLAQLIKLLPVASPLQALHDGGIFMRTHQARIDGDVNVNRTYVPEVSALSPESLQDKIGGPAAHQHQGLSIRPQDGHQLQVDGQ